MNSQTTAVTFGCLLHDTGKPCYRAGAGGTHSASGYAFLKSIWKDEAAGPILDCLRWHHAAELRQGKPKSDSIAYIAYIADNIAAAADRRAAQEEGHFERYLPLSPVFSHLNGEHPGFSVPLARQDGILRMPQSGEHQTTQAEYRNLLRDLETQLKALPPEEEWLNSLLALLEGCTSSIPSSTNTGESPDISLYDHAKITAAVGACISEYLLDAQITDYRQTLFSAEAEFRKKEAFLLYSADFSGIQKFIYTVSTKGALKALRSRSFFLELAMEHYIDELLCLCGLSRANLLYAGGGHCYLLLPNTEAVKAALARWNTHFNSWLADQFGTVLYLADGFTPCSANDLTNTPAEEAPYKAMFRRVSAAVAKKKLHRYSAQQILNMNHREEDLSGRECRVCGRTEQLVSGEDGTSLCPWCKTFEKLSSLIQNSKVYLVTDGTGDFSLPTPDGMAGFLLTDETAARRCLKENAPIRRIYTKNKTYAGLKYSTRIYVGDYAPSNSMEELAGKSTGITRLAICRMDVDNLGQSFVAGFEQADRENRHHYVTISRTAAFSRQMSLFFKCYINSILSGEFQQKKPLNTTIVYSGGDDVFLVGAWNDTMEAALRIRNALREFTCGALTISGGIGIFHDHHPIRLAAAQTAELESEAKALPGKDAVALFAPDSGNVYPWAEFDRCVLGEKYQVLEQFFKSDRNERGTAFLYRMLELLRQAQDASKMPIARLAYLLARLEPSPREEGYQYYKPFSQKVYLWSLNPKDRGQLITAISLYVYRNRKEENNNGI